MIIQVYFLFITFRFFTSNVNYIHQIFFFHKFIFIKPKQLDEINSQLLDFPNELKILKEVSTLQLENFKNEILVFCNRVRKLKTQIDLVNDQQLNNLKDFFNQALEATNSIEKNENILESWKIKLANHFCEETSIFKLEDCFSILYKFCEKFKKCSQDNQERRFSELRRSSSIRSSHKYTQQRKVNANVENKSSDESSNKNYDANEKCNYLEDYSCGNEIRFSRRSSLRINRKSMLIPGNYYIR